LSICKSSPKSIGSLIGEVGFLSLHYLHAILGSKTGFRPQTPNEWFPHTTGVVTHQQRVTYQVWLNLKIANHLGDPTIEQKLPKITPSLHKLSIQPLRGMLHNVKKL